MFQPLGVCCTTKPIDAVFWHPGASGTWWSAVVWGGLGLVVGFVGLGFRV